jgi:type IV pilus assembly protein PilB
MRASREGIDTVTRFDAHQLASGADAEPEPPPARSDHEPARTADRPDAEEGDTLLPGDEQEAEPGHEADGVDEIEASRLPEPSLLLRFGPETSPSAPTTPPEGSPSPEVPGSEVMPAPPTGTVRIKKSSARKHSEKPDRHRMFGRRAGTAPKDTPSAAAVAPVEAQVGHPTHEQSPAPDEEHEDGPRHVGLPLGELLLHRGLVSEEQLREALTTQTGSGKRLGNILVELGLLSERALVAVLAEQLQVDIIELGNLELDREIVTLLSEQDARRLRAVPIAREGVRIDVAVADPLATSLQDELIAKLAAPVRLVFATGTDIEAVINKMYASATDLGDALRMFEARLVARQSSRETEQTIGTVVDENAPVVKVVNLILDTAVRARASDVHIEQMADHVRVRMRTDGALHEAMTLPGPMGPSLVSRIKVMSDMNIVERRKPQDGQLAFTVAGRDLDVRVSTAPTVFGEKCVLRVLDKTKAVIELPGLGMAPDTYGRYSDLIRSPYGMVICAGPTGSGKTTTLYATLTAISNDDINVVTIEDPVEYVFPAINQIQINEAAGLTFANGLRAILRQDPDSILVGEIRDVETARIAVQAALTGHFVMSSLHATDATSALHRFMDMGIEPFLVASSLLGVVGQRLVRKVCPNCMEPYDPTPDERAFYERGGGDTEKNRFVVGAGCNFCGNTGYYDRVGIYEVLAVTDELKELIVENAPQAAFRQLAISQGMRTLRDQAIQLVTQNKTTIAEVLRTVYVL